MHIFFFAEGGCLQRVAGRFLGEYLAQPGQCGFLNVQTALHCVLSRHDSLMLIVSALLDEIDMSTGI